MKDKIQIMLFVSAFFIRFILDIVLKDTFISSVYSIIFIFIYSIMIYKKCKSINFIPVIMLDFISNFYLCLASYGYGVTSIVISVTRFLIANVLLYYLIIFYIETNNVITLKKESRIAIDKGISALEKNEYDLALEEFKTAIKKHKENYLGYMGMCNTLKSMQSIDLKKLNYYKKKCVKYAPKELKENINNKY